MEMASPGAAGSWSVKRFILQQNIHQLQDVLSEDRESEENIWERMTLASSRRTLAQIESAMFGVRASRGRLGQSYSQAMASCSDARLFHGMVETVSQPFLILDPRPGLHIVDVNDAYANVTMTPRESVAGARLFDAFPDNPDDPDADGVSKLYASLLMATQSARPHSMEIQRYDVRGADGMFVERYWRPRNTPIFDEHGGLMFLLHQVDDVTNEVIGREGVTANN